MHSSYVNRLFRINGIISAQVNSLLSYKSLEAFFSTIVRVLQFTREILTLSLRLMLLDSV